MSKINGTIKKTLNEAGDMVECKCKFVPILNCYTYERCPIILAVHMLKNKIRLHCPPTFNDEYNILFSEPLRSRLLKSLRKYKKRIPTV